MPYKGRLTKSMIIADETDIRISFNEKHRLFMRTYGRDGISVERYAMSLDPIIDMLNITPTDVVIDAGAYIGRSARYIFSKGASTVVSIEAFANNYVILEKNASDERMLLKATPEQKHIIIPGAFWRQDKSNSGRVYLNNNTSSYGEMTTHRLYESNITAWTNAISVEDLFRAVNPTVAVIDVNGSEMDFLKVESTIKIFSRYLREFLVIYNFREQDHRLYAHDADEYFTRKYGYKHILRPRFSAFRTKRSDKFLFRLPAVYRKVVTNVIKHPKSYERGKTVFAVKPRAFEQQQATTEILQRFNPGKVILSEHHKPIPGFDKQIAPVV